MSTSKSSRPVSAAVLWGRAAALCLLCLSAPGCHSQDSDDNSTGPSTTGPASATTQASKQARTEFAVRRAERDAMVRQIERYGLTDKTVLAAMRAVPRHEFVPPDMSKFAYSDGPLPIGKGQTISQPYIVAEMTRQLHLSANARVLEVGTGSGYQAAVLAEITPHVYTIEIVRSLADSAEARLRRLGYDTVNIRHGDGYMGWKEHAPFDAIIVTCGASEIPKPLLEQLAPGGQMVIPVGDELSGQQLMLVKKSSDGKTHTKNLLPVRFVPLTREVR